MTSNTSDTNPPTIPDKSLEGPWSGAFNAAHTPSLLGEITTHGTDLGYAAAKESADAQIRAILAAFDGSKETVDQLCERLCTTLGLGDTAAEELTGEIAELCAFDGPIAPGRHTQEGSTPVAVLVTFDIDEVAIACMAAWACNDTGDDPYPTYRYTDKEGTTYRTGWSNGINIIIVESGPGSVKEQVKNG